jgi:GGDEF domain-containing protein
MYAGMFRCPCAWEVRFTKHKESAMFDSHIAGDGDKTLHSAPDPCIIVFPTRRAFATGISPILERRSACAVLYLTLLSDGKNTKALSPRLLNLVANTLRAAMRTGAGAYLGGGEFAILLQGTDAQRAEACARVVVSIVSEFKLPRDGKRYPIKACIGGVMAEDRNDGELLLNMAEQACLMARYELGRAVHIVDGPSPWVRLPREVPANLAAHAA